MEILMHQRFIIAQVFSLLTMANTEVTNGQFVTALQ